MRQLVLAISLFSVVFAADGMAACRQQQIDRTAACSKKPNSKTCKRSKSRLAQCLARENSNNNSQSSSSGGSNFSGY